jgi:hypothetical protein
MKSKPCKHSGLKLIYLHRGAFQAEIIPIEPAPGNAGEGKLLTVLPGRAYALHCSVYCDPFFVRPWFHS